MPMPAVMISDLLEPHAFTSPMQFCSRALLLSQDRHPLYTPGKSTQKHHLSPQVYLASRLPSLELVPNLTLRLNLEPFSLFSFPVGTLPLLFHRPSLPFLVLPYYDFPGNVLLPTRYVPTIGLAVALELHSFRVVFSSFPERWFPRGDPARSDDQKSPNRKFHKAAVFPYGAPRQPPLQDNAAYAHPSFRPQQRPL